MDPTARADSATDESGHQLTLLAHHLGLGHAISVVHVSGQQDSSDFRGVESSASVNNPLTYQCETQDGLCSQNEPSELDLTPASVDNPLTYQLETQDRFCSQNEPSELDLTPAFLCLSTSDAPVLLEPHAPPGSPSASPFNNAYKYYVIIRGKCTGVYYGEWYVFHHESSSA